MKAVKFLSFAVLTLGLIDACHAQLYRRTAEAGPEFDQHALVKLVRTEQKQNVRESWGEDAYQCFTDADLAIFRSTNAPLQVTDRLKKDPEFLALVQQVRQMPPRDRALLLQRAGATCTPTWAQLGRISSAGQTDAGQQAQRLLARAIVKLVAESLAAQ